MSDTFSRTTKVFGGTIRELPGGSVVAVSHFQFEAEDFGTFDAARQWLQMRMDAAMAGGFGGKIRQQSSGSFVATSYFQEESSIHSSLQGAEEWLLEQKALASSPLSHINKTEE
jgi:hypothetical protein